MRVPRLLILVAGPLRRRIAGLALLAGLGLPATARAQAPARPGLPSQPAPSAGTRITLDGPSRTGPGPIFYLNGQRCDSLPLITLNPGDIASVEVPKTGAIARQLGPDEAQRGVIFITTKAGQHTRRVRAFRRRLARLERAANPAAPGAAAPQRPAG